MAQKYTSIHTGAIIDDSVQKTQDITTYGKDPTGWLDNTAITSSYDSSARTITLTGDLRYFWRGEIKELTSPWTSSAHTATADTFFFLSSTDGTTFTWSTTAWDFYDLMVGACWYGADEKFGLVETHGLIPWQSHEELHEQIGTYRKAGGGLSNYALASTTAGDRRPDIAACQVKDEDIITINPEVTDNRYTNAYLTGAGVLNFNTDQADFPLKSGTQPYWNEYSGGTWGQTLLTASQFMNYWLFAVPATADANSQLYRFFWLQGQTASLTQAIVEDQSVYDLELGNLSNIFVEFIAIAQVTIKYIGGNWQLVTVQDLTGNRQLALSSGASGVYLSAVSADATLTGSGTTGDPLGVVNDGHTHATQYAALANGVTNGDSHDHSGGDGAQIAYSSLGSIPATFAPDTHGNSAHSSTFAVAPGSSVNNGVVAWNGTGGLTLKDSGVVYTDLTTKPATPVNNQLAAWNGTAGALKNSGIDLSNVLVDSDIGTNVQAYDAGLAYLDGLNFTNESTFKAGVNLEIGTDVQAFDADILKADTSDQLTAGFGTTNVTSTDASFTPNFAAGNVFEWTYTGAATLNNPTNKMPGSWKIYMLGTGFSGLTLGTDYNDVSGAFSASEVNVLTLDCDGSDIYVYYAQVL
jgi:hypothetical protein